MPGNFRIAEDYCVIIADKCISKRYVIASGDPRVRTFENGLMNETIDYNERFSWDNRGWRIGRAGFGPYGMSDAVSAAVD
jgi:hypothetical protein